MRVFSKFIIGSVYILLFFTSCNKTKDIAPKEIKINTKNIEENTWIFKQMKEIYLWENMMPPEDKTDKNLPPEKYFNSILAKAGEFDRVSYMKLNQEDLVGQLSGNLKSFGFRYIKFFTNESKREIALSVSLVYTGSNADKSGLKRGHIITKINAKTITTDNVDALLEPENITLELSEIKEKNTFVFSKSIAMTKVLYQIDPLHFGYTFLKGDRTIGYLVYNQFLTDYDNEIRRAVGYFKSRKVNEFILDLRFNPGGFTPNAEIVASLFVKNLKPGTEMYHGEWNEYQTKTKLAKDGKNAGFRSWTDEPNNIGNLDRIYILTSKSTSSSSELLINSLLPFMKVITVGENTFGKNVISQIVVDETKKNNLGLLPAYCKTYNAAGQSEYGTKDGFIPTIKVSDNVFPLLELGDPNESFLAAALNDISKEPFITGNAKNSVIMKAKLVDTYQHADSKILNDGLMFSKIIKK
jgi:carboxyl-terminal processing protease